MSAETSDQRIRFGPWSVRLSTLRITGAYIAASVVAAAGSGLLIAGMLPPPEYELTPGPVQFDSDLHRRCLEVAADLDEACRLGDYRAFRAVSTAGFITEVRDQLRRAGRPLQSESLAAQGALIGDLSANELLGGRATTTRAVLIYSRSTLRERRVGELRHAGLRAVVFAWDGGRLRVAARFSRALGRAESEAAAVAAWMNELLSAN